MGLKNKTHSWPGIKTAHWHLHLPPPMMNGKRRLAGVDSCTGRSVTNGNVLHFTGKGPHMALVANFTLNREFTVKASAADVFAILADVPASVSHFPRVERLVDLGNNRYQWEMERIGPGNMSLKTVYACDYTSSKSKGSVAWAPVPGIGNAEISGEWKIKPRKGKPAGTHVTLVIHGEQSIPMPRLMTSVVTPIVRAEFSSLIDGYVANLIERFGGEA